MSRSNGNSPARYLPGLAVLAFCAAAATQGHKQLVVREDIVRRGMETGRYVFTHIDLPRRGTIFTADGEIAARNEDAATIGIRFDRVPNSPSFFMALSEATGISASEFEQLANDPAVVSREWRPFLSAAQVRKLESVRSDWRADGLSIHRNGVREYPLGYAASSFLGILNDGKGAFGVEKAFDPLLSGTPGKTIGMVDADGSFLPMRLDRESAKRKDGANLVLTIDKDVQLAAAEAVRNAVETHKASFGTAVVLDPQTGDILAMANWPSFDPIDPASSSKNGVSSIGLNPNYMLAWEPGSTFKILTLAKGLEDKAITMKTVFHCTGAKEVWPGTVVHCDDHGGSPAHGPTDPLKAIYASCNVTAAVWGQAIGHKAMTEFIDEIGLSRPTETGLPGEVGGGFNRNEFAKGLQVATMGFGQSLTATPLGLASAFATVANLGVRMEPRIVKEIDGKALPPRAAKRILSREVCKEVLDAMVLVFESNRGTGRRLRIPGYQLGGKTGTAQKIGREFGTTGRRAYVANFVGFVPALDPRAVILVMIDNPSMGRIYGSDVAGPVFVDIAKAVIRKLNIPRSQPATVEAPPARREPAAKPLGPNVTVDSKAVPTLDPAANGGA